MGQKSIMEFDVAAARKVIEFVQAHKDVKPGLKAARRAPQFSKR